GNDAGAGRQARPHLERGAGQVRVDAGGPSGTKGETGRVKAVSRAWTAGIPQYDIEDIQEIDMAVARAEILDAISNMTVLELSQLIKDMEEKFGVSAAAAAVAAAPAAGGAAPAAAEEKTEFTVNLLAAGPNKVNVIKVVR